MISWEPLLEDLPSDGFAEEDCSGLCDIERFGVSGHWDGHSWSQGRIGDAVCFIADDKRGLIEIKIVLVEQADRRIWEGKPECFSSELFEVLLGVFQGLEYRELECELRAHSRPDDLGSEGIRAAFDEPDLVESDCPCGSEYRAHVAGFCDSIKHKYECIRELFW